MMTEDDLDREWARNRAIEDHGYGLHEREPDLNCPLCDPSIDE